MINYQKERLRTFYTYIVVDDDMAHRDHDSSYSKGRPPLPLHLATNPQDMCMTIEGGSIIGQHYSSNTIVIPKAAIAAAVAAALPASR